MPAAATDELGEAVVDAHRARSAGSGRRARRRRACRCGRRDRSGRRPPAAARRGSERTPARAIASASGVRCGDQATSTQWPSAFMPVSALTRAACRQREVGVVDRRHRRRGRSAGALLLPGRRIGHAEHRRELGARVGGGDGDVGQHRPIGERRRRHALLLLGEEATALPRSAHEPPPNDTMPSMPSRRAWRSASCTSGTGTCDSTRSNVDARLRPMPPHAPAGRRRWPPGRRWSRAAPTAGQRRQEVREPAERSRHRTRSAGRARCASRSRRLHGTSGRVSRRRVGRASSAQRSNSSPKTAGVAG